MVDITIEAQKILSCIYRVRERFGITVIVQVLRGSRNKRILQLGLDKVSTYGIMKEYYEDVLKEIIMTLISMDYIHITADKYPVLKLTPSSFSILKGEKKVHHKKDLLEIESTPKRQLDTNYIDANYNEELFERLRELRYKIAEEKKIAPFIIFHDSTLKEMATYYPKDKESFMSIKGVGLKKYESYGEEFIDVIRDFVDEKKIDVSNIEKVEVESSSKEGAADRYPLTYECYLEGLSLHEIAEKRGYTVNTIINHLKKCEEMGMAIDWSRFMDDPTKERQILKAIDKVGPDRLKPIKEIVSENISYEDIRITIIKNRL